MYQNICSLYASAMILAQESTQAMRLVAATLQHFPRI